MRYSYIFIAATCISSATLAPAFPIPSGVSRSHENLGYQDPIATQSQSQSPKHVATLPQTSDSKPSFSSSDKKKTTVEQDDDSGITTDSESEDGTGAHMFKNAERLTFIEPDFNDVGGTLYFALPTGFKPKRTAPVSHNKEGYSRRGTRITMFEDSSNNQFLDCSFSSTHHPGGSITMFKNSRDEHFDSCQFNMSKEIVKVDTDRLRSEGATGRGPVYDTSGKIIEGEWV